MYINGKEIRDRIQHELAQKLQKRTSPLTLAIIIVGENPVIEGFVAIKKRFAGAIGVQVLEKRFVADVSQQDLLNTLKKLSEDDTVSGIVVQLPLPVHIETQDILNQIPLNKDVDVLSQAGVDAFTAGTLMVLPPVVGAIAEVLYGVDIKLAGVRALVVGQGRLVGAPVALWLTRMGAHVTTTTDRSSDALPALARDAQVIVSGVGVPGLITEDMVNADAILVDAGTSESSGRIVGDIDIKALEKARFATPVPGGLGPVTVAILFRNLVLLSENSAVK